MKKIKRFVAAFLIILLVMSLAACSPGGIVVSSETPEPTPTVVPTPTPMTTPSPTPTVEPTPTPTPRNIEAKAGIKKGQDKVEAEVNQRFEDFLNGTGAFTDELIKGMAFKGDVVLGYQFHYQDSSAAVFKGVLLFYEKVDNGEIIALGTENRTDNRIITLVEFPSQFFVQCSSPITVCVYTSYSSYDSHVLLRSFPGRSSDYYTLLDENLEKPILLDIAILSTTEDKGFSDISEEYKEPSKLMDAKIDVNCMFIASFDIPKNISGSAKIQEYKDTNRSKLITVKTYQEFEEQVESNYGNIPNTYNLGFASY